MDLITPEIGLIFWTALTFAVLLFLLRKFAWKPILGAVSDREKGITDALAAADNARKEMENLTADNERILKEARAEREAMMKDARDLKAKILADAEDEAKVRAEKLITNAQAAIDAERKSAIADLKSQVAALSVDIAEKVVKNELSDKDKQLKLVDDMIGQATLN